jgi:lipid-A-disaccharide synthase
LSDSGRPLNIWLVAGEESGDQLGAKLMRAHKNRLGEDRVTFGGVGGEAMSREGLTSLFPLTDITVMGINTAIRRFPAIVRRVYRLVAAAAAAKPDALVIIDSPDFTHPVAKRVHKRLPNLPIINYVSPSVWAWRPGRARKMRAYIDHVLALKSFEPEVHQRLGGPACTYVGHPLIERLADLRPGPGERPPLGEGPLNVLVLPGSRPLEVSRLAKPFGAALKRVLERVGRPVSVTIPGLPHLREHIRAATADWPIAPAIVEGEAAKHAAFRSAHVALAASGTVTLELALAGVPMVVGYRLSEFEAQVAKRVIRVPTIVLPNLILGETVIPDFIQWDCTPDNLADALMPLMSDTPERRRQLEAFGRLDALMAIGDETPSERATRVICETIEAKRAGPARFA